ncbi:MAG: NifB/NifX family molybdenum-iron cluster-binding protein [Candidatus Aenigmatarchaeota archaeon]
MKVAVTAEKKDMDSSPSSVFGRCPYFAIANTKKEDVKFVENDARNQRGGAGTAAAQTVGDEGAEAVVTGKVGPNAFRVLDQLGIDVYEADLDRSICENVEMLKDGKLEKVEGATGASGRGRRG